MYGTKLFEGLNATNQHAYHGTCLLVSAPEMPVLVGWRNKEWGSFLENDPSETTDPECGTPLSISSRFIETRPCPAGAPSSVSLKYLACTSMKALPCLHARLLSVVSLKAYVNL